MPEIKNTFTGGKMNKDLDERLVPKGEYTDAMNVEVASSDDDSVGTVQNLSGNQGFAGNTLVPGDSVCIGAVTDEATDSLYWLVATDKMDLNWRSSPPPGNPQVRFNAIFEYNRGNSPNSINPIFVDKHHVIASVEDFFDYAANNTHQNIFSNVDLGLHIGMEVTLHDSVNTSLGVILELIPNHPLAGGVGTLITVSKGHNNLLNGNYVFIEFSGHVTNWSTSTLVTGINIIDDMLFWTDNESEPKKINIPRSKQGTFQYTNVVDAEHTDLINKNQNEGPIKESHITVIKGKPSTPISLEMKQIGGLNTGRYGWCVDDGRIGFGTTNPFWKAGDVQWFSGANKIETIDSFSFDGVKKMDLKAGDILLFKYKGVALVNQSDFPIIDYDVRAKISNNPSGNTFAGNMSLQVEILYVNPEDWAGLTTNTDHWAVQKEVTTKPLFELKFPRFSYRWKYEDGEYSTFAPWSEIAFLASPFRYLPEEGFNLGMVNNIEELTIYDFVTADTPLDITQVDLLYKESDSPNVYIVDTLKPSDIPPIGLSENPWNSLGSQQNPTLGQEYSEIPKGAYKVTSETIFATVAPNQLIRNWDAVPKKALAQEVIGNRLVYANYTKNFDLSNNAQVFTADLTTVSKSFNVQDMKYKSVKSIREYQVGISYADEYGRETPVFTNKDSVISIPKLYSIKSNTLYTKINNTAPVKADSYKFYIKETSSKYHNLVMDRWYDAEDGNIWLSFHSHDRNKVDEETFLYLKRGHNGLVVTDDYKYKILAVKNEAPEFIRKTAKQFGIKPNNAADFGLAPTDFTTNGELYLDAGGNLTKAMPTSINRRAMVGSKDIWLIDGLVEHSSWHSMALNAGPFSTKLKVRFHKYASSATAIHKGEGQFHYDEEPTQVSGWYKIDKLKAIGNYYLINLAKELENDALFINPTATQDPYNTGATASDIAIEITEELAENLPEFDGRFFVKILGDASTETFISDSGAYNVSYSQPLYYYNQPDISGPSYAAEAGGTVDLELFKDNNAGGFGTGTTDSSGLFRAPNAINYDTIKDKWELEFGDGTQGVITINAATAGGPKIFIDKLKYQGSHVGTRANSAGSSGTPTYPIYSGGSATGPYGPTDFTPGAGHGIDPGNNTIDISIAGLAGGNNKHWPNGSSFTGYFDSLDVDYTWFLGGWGPLVNGYVSGGSMSNIPDVVNTSNFYLPGSPPGDLGTSAFVQNIKVNAKFKFSEDPMNEIYTIQAIEVYHRWNYLDEDLYIDSLPSTSGINTWLFFVGMGAPYDAYWNGYDGGTTTSGTTPNVIHNIQEPYKTASNRRVTYRLTLDKTIGTTFGYDPTATDCTTEDAGSSIQFVTQSIDHTIDKTSDSPAVWETEPKEVSDIDIYYQASQTYPKDLTTKNISNVFAIGDIVESDAISVDFDSDINGATIMGFDSILPGKIQIKNIDLTGSFAFPGQRVIKIFDQKNKSYVELKAVPYGPTLNNETWIKLDTNTHNWGRTLDWHNCYSFGNGVESDTIRDDYNQVTIDNGVTASTTVGWEYENERLKNGLIFSGLYNNKTSLNDLNQFIESENITKDLNPSYGSIQKLHTRDSDLIALCEDKVVKILANKDALYNADENSQLIATKNVLGQAQPFVGDWGISTNPESFAKENFRSYFVDRKRGAVLRLSRDGLTAISEAGMKDWFRDSLSPLTGTQRIHGSYDTHKSLYNVTIPGSQYTNEFTKTISFSENSKGWPSFKSFIPEKGISMNNDYFTFDNGLLYQHHIGNINSFYGNAITEENFSSIKFIFNADPSVVKSFTTINYEGTQSKILFRDDDSLYTNLFAKDGWYVNSIQTDKQEGRVPDFVEKEGKWFNHIMGIHSSNTSDRLLNLDTREFSFQGIETIEIQPKLLGDNLIYSNCDGAGFSPAPTTTVSDPNILISCDEII